MTQPRCFESTHLDDTGPERTAESFGSEKDKELASRFEVRIVELIGFRSGFLKERSFAPFRTLVPPFQSKLCVM